MYLLYNTQISQLKAAVFLRFFVALIAKEVDESLRADTPASSQDLSSDDSDTGSDLTELSASRYRLPSVDKGHQVGLYYVFMYTRSKLLFTGLLFLVLLAMALAKHV